MYSEVPSEDNAESMPFDSVANDETVESMQVTLEGQTEGACSDSEKECEQEQLPDFDEVRAPWMVRLYALQEEFDKISAQNKELMQKNSESLKLLEQRNRLVDMVKSLDVKNQELRRENSRLKELHSDAEYQEMIEQAMKYVHDAHNDADNKKAELKKLEAKVAAVKAEYRDLIRKRATQEELVLRIPRGKGKLMQSYAGLCGENLGDMVVRIFEEAISKVPTATAVDKSETIR